MPKPPPEGARWGDDPSPRPEPPILPTPTDPNEEKLRLLYRRITTDYPHFALSKSDVSEDEFVKETLRLQIDRLEYTHRAYSCNVSLSQAVDNICDNYIGWTSKVDDVYIFSSADDGEESRREENIRYNYFYIIISGVFSAISIYDVFIYDFIPNTGTLKIITLISWFLFCFFVLRSFFLKDPNPDV